MLVKYTYYFEHVFSFVDDNAYVVTEVLQNDTHSSFGSSFEEVEDSLSSFSDSDSNHSERITYNNKQQKPKRTSKAIRTLKQRYRYNNVILYFNLSL